MIIGQTFISYFTIIKVRNKIKRILFWPYHESYRICNSIFKVKIFAELPIDHATCSYGCRRGICPLSAVVAVRNICCSIFSTAAVVFKACDIALSRSFHRGRSHGRHAVMDTCVGVSNIVRNYIGDLFQCINKILCASCIENIRSFALITSVIVSCSRVGKANKALYALIILLISPCENAVEFCLVCIHEHTCIIFRCVKLCRNVLAHRVVIFMCRWLAVGQEDNKRFFVCLLIGCQRSYDIMCLLQSFFPVGSGRDCQSTNNILDCGRIRIAGSAKIKICLTSSSKIRNGNLNDIRILRCILGKKAVDNAAIIGQRMVFSPEARTGIELTRKRITVAVAAAPLTCSGLVPGSVIVIHF